MLLFTDNAAEDRQQSVRERFPRERPVEAREPLGVASVDVVFSGDLVETS